MFSLGMVVVLGIRGIDLSGQGVSGQLQQDQMGLGWMDAGDGDRLDYYLIDWWCVCSPPNWFWPCTSFAELLPK